MSEIKEKYCSYCNKIIPLPSNNCQKYHKDCYKIIMKSKVKGYCKKYYSKDSSKLVKHNYYLKVRKPKMEKVRLAREPKKCLYCGITLSGEKRKWCSGRCHTANYRLNKTGKKTKLMIKQEFCKMCGNINPEGRWMFCSKKCSLQFNSRQEKSKLRKRDYFKNNKDKRTMQIKRAYERNKDKRLLKNKEWRANNKERVRVVRNKHIRERKASDLSYRIQINIRRRFAEAITHYSLTGKIYSCAKYGIDFKAIIEHLTPFPEDLSKYHIDHIKPLCSFDLTNPEEVKKAFAPENHQWLTIEENRMKAKEDIKKSLWRKKTNPSLPSLNP